MEHQLDSDPAGWPAVYRVLRDQHYVRLWLQCPAGSRREHHRGSAQCESMDQSRGLREPTGGNYHRAVQLCSVGGAPSQFLGPGYHRMDGSFFKNFRTTERTHLEFRAEIFNLTNHPNFSPPGFSGNGVTAAPGSLDYTSPSTFGRITSTRDGQNDQREIQFALKFYF